MSFGPVLLIKCSFDSGLERPGQQLQWRVNSPIVGAKSDEIQEALQFLILFPCCKQLGFHREGE
eukprot:2519850-Amphidinium_carterae.1